MTERPALPRLQHRGRHDRPHFAPHPLARSLALALAALAAGGAFIAPASANPQGGVVVAGQASIAQPSAALMQINQSSPRAVIDWRSFSIGAGEAVRFNQPSPLAATLNRVVGNEPSNLLGSLSANGRVYLVNQNGVFVGPGAQLDAAALVLSTANISNDDFMAGRLLFSQPGKLGARIVNEGRITAAEGGLVALVAPGVENRGVISAKLGQVMLAGAPAFSLDLFGDGMVNLVLSKADMGGIVDATGKPLANYVDSSGKVTAEGGRIWISAAAARGVVDSMVAISGELRATRVAQQGGDITLLGGDKLDVNGNVIATSADSAGGRIAASADRILLASNTVLDARGATGGGSVNIGGTFQGKTPVAGAASTARTLQVDAGAQVKADTTGPAGNGGQVVLWSEEATRFAGHASARAGAAAGNGGLIEVSGKKQLAFEGSANASAPSGTAGTLLLDPASLTVASIGFGGFGGFTATGGISSIVAASTINGVLRTGTTVSLKADDDINIASPIDGRPVLGSPFAFPGGGLNLEAGGAVTVNAPVVLNNGAFSSSSDSFSQAAGNVIATGGDKPISIATRGDSSTQHLLTTGGVNLASSGGSIAAGETLGGLAPDGVLRPLSTLNVSAPSGTATLLAGLQTSGDTTLNARRVQLGNAIVGGALGVAASESVVLSGSAKVGALQAGRAGAPLGSFAITGSGIATAPRVDAGAGGVDIVAQSVGDLGHIRSGGPIAIQSTGSDVRLGRLEATTASAITVTSAGSIDLPQGSTVFSNGGDVTLRANAGHIKAADTIAANASDAARPVPRDGKITLTASADVSVKQLVALNGVEIKSASGSVMLEESLGGTSIDRPLVGFLDIQAGKDIVTNGLNLAGRTTEANVEANGLRLNAGTAGSGQIVVNDRIGVSAGHLLFGPATPTENPDYSATLYQGVYARTGSQNIKFNVPVIADGTRINQGWRALLGTNVNPATNFEVSDDLNAKLLDMVLIPTGLGNGDAAKLVESGGGLRVLFDQTQGEKGRLKYICPVDGCGNVGGGGTEQWMIPKIVVSNQEKLSSNDTGRISFQSIRLATNAVPNGAAANAALKILIPMSENERVVVTVPRGGTLVDYFRRFELTVSARGQPRVSGDPLPQPEFDYGLIESVDKANIDHLDLRFPTNLLPRVNVIGRNFSYYNAVAKVDESTGSRNLRTPIDQNSAAAVDLVIYPGRLSDGVATTSGDGVGRIPSGTFGYRSNSSPLDFRVASIGGGGGLSLSEQIAGAPTQSATSSQAAVQGDIVAAVAATERKTSQGAETPCPGRERVVVGRSAGDEADFGALPALRGAPRTVFSTTYSLGEVSAQLPTADEAAIVGLRRSVTCL